MDSTTVIAILFGLGAFIITELVLYGIMFIGALPGLAMKSPVVAFMGAATIPGLFIGLAGFLCPPIWLAFPLVIVNAGILCATVS